MIFPVRLSITTDVETNSMFSVIDCGGGKKADKCGNCPDGDRGCRGVCQWDKDKSKCLIKGKRSDYLIFLHIISC